MGGASSTLVQSENSDLMLQSQKHNVKRSATCKVVRGCRDAVKGRARCKGSRWGVYMRRPGSDTPGFLLAMKWIQPLAFL